MKSAIQSIAFVLFAGLALAGCNKHDDITPDRWNGEIRLSSEIASQVKTRATDVPDKQIASGKTVSFFVDDAGAGTVLYEDYLLTANGNGGFTKYNQQAEDMHYPATGNGVDIYAFLTDGFASGPSFPTAAITHTVSDDQSVQHGANYLSSDLLYAAHKAVARSNQPVQMNFYHLLSKVEVALKSGVGAPDLNGAVVTIENTRLKADFLPDKSKDINHTTTGQATRAAMITPTASNNPTASIKIGTAVSTNFSAYASAVVVPQTVAQNSRFIKVTLASGGVLYYTIPDADGLKLESGHKYQFHITVNLTGLTVQSTISDWATGVPIGGTAEMPPPVGSKEPATAAIGDFYFSDGTLEDKSATLTPDQQAACIGIVFKVGKDDSGNWKDDCKYYQKDGITPMTAIHGYVLGLYDVEDESGNKLILWGSFGTQVEHNDMNREKETGFYGYKNTNAIKVFATEKGWTLQSAFPATYYATEGYEARSPAPANSSGWFFPSGGQGRYWIYNKAVLLASVQKATGNSSYTWQNWYWSSSEFDGYPANRAWNVNFYFNHIENSDKNGSYVRSIFAF